MRSYDQFISSVLKLYESQEYEQALSFLESGMNQFPEQIQYHTYASACLTAVIGNVSKSINILQEGLDKGLWFPEEILRNDPNFVSLQGDSQFEQVVEVCKQRMAITQANSKPQRKLLVPQRKSPYPLLLALHGNNSNADQVQPFWEEALSHGWGLLVPQSSQVWGPERYVWNDCNVGVQEVKTHFSEIHAETDVLDEHVIISGFSMGAGVAILMALTGEIKTRGFIAVAPWLPDVENLALYKDKFLPELRGYFIVGENDARSIELTAQITELMSSQGLQFQVETHNKLGHEFPVRFSESLVKALGFVDGSLD